MKRKAQDEKPDIPDEANGRADKKRRSSIDKTSRSAVQHHFCSGMFEKTVLQEYKSSYATSEPYKHGVIQNLIAPDLLRHETDIYKIHQPGDLANLDGLDDSSLKLLPSLLTLRDALYSAAFRDYFSAITGSGPLSGRKTDMAINVYTPGCHLLCHDDVIGSRRVSYILYLTDPDRPWRAEWGGALRLYPMQTFIGDNGGETKVPNPDFSVSIPPAFNQLTFFAVQPGESFHDVEEVYARKEGEKEGDDGGRVRMAISGWYHIPQEGEDGYEEGLEERLAEKSSLMQLQGKGDKYDLPQAQIQTYDQENGDTTVDGNGKQLVKASDEDDDLTLTVADFDFLLEFLAPTYLTPDTLSSLSSIFADESSLRLSDVLSAKFSSSLRSSITSQEQEHPLDNLSSAEIEASTDWKVARPPHKHRFLFQQPSLSTQVSTAESTPLHSLLNTLLPSRPFRKWLALATGLTLTSHDILARCFRRGTDYTLATGYNEDVSRLEVTLGITPTKGWGGDEDEDADKEGKAEDGSPTVANESKEPEEDEYEEADEDGKEETTDATVGNAKKAGNNKHEDADEDVKEKDSDSTANRYTRAEVDDEEQGDENETEKDKRATVAKGANEVRDSNEAPVDAEKEHDPHTAAPEENGRDNNPPIASDDEPSSTAEEEKGKSHDTRAPAAPVSEKPLPATTNPPAPSTSGNPVPTTDVGGYEVYMAGDGDLDTGSDAGVPVRPPSAQNPYPTPSSSFPPFYFLFLTPQSKSNPDPKSNPNPNPNPTTTKSSDPAVYHSATAGEDDGVLFFMAAGWNVMRVVFRDRGVLRFVKRTIKRCDGLDLSNWGDPQQQVKNHKTPS
ncbi:2og-fe oxygenase family protein [Lasallia pustulata]|uniref:uS12 prolyl 3,4-dihydroxylase n=1 Tax=Lasallia pustulata TaxID=136370 RepID=A0A1W5D5T4_9LECA|nr:2og-fe oxygenase family protein [Lasallia pustulata]